MSSSRCSLTAVLPPDRTRPMSLSMEPCTAGSSVCSPSSWPTASSAPSSLHSVSMSDPRVRPPAAVPLRVHHVCLDSIRSPLHDAQAPGGQTQPVLCLPAHSSRPPGPPGSCQPSSECPHHLPDLALFLLRPQNRSETCML